MKIKVSRDWLIACGRIDGPDTFEVTRVQNMRGDEKMYHVIDIDGRNWAVWSIRGVEVIDDSMTALDSLVTDVNNRVKAEVNTRLHMFNEGIKSQATAASTAAMYVQNLHSSADMLAKMCKVAEITEASHGPLIQAQIDIAAQYLAQLMAIKLAMKAE